jgi:hypothetical protein
MVKNLLHIDKKEKHISIEQYNKELDVAMNQINKGEFKTHAEIVKDSEKWFRRK